MDILGQLVFFIFTEYHIALIKYDISPIPPALLVLIRRVLSQDLATSRRVMLRTERGRKVLQQGSDALMDYVESLTGSEGSEQQAGVRSVLLGRLVLDVTSTATFEPASCDSPPLVLAHRFFFLMATSHSAGG